MGSLFSPKIPKVETPVMPQTEEPLNAYEQALELRRGASKTLLTPGGALGMTSAAPVKKVMLGVG